MESVHVMVLGNGFDLAVGRKTSYKNFYDSGLCPTDFPSPIIDYLNRHMNQDPEAHNWLDLENTLRNYALESMNNPSDFFSSDDDGCLCASEHLALQTIEDQLMRYLAEQHMPAPSADNKALQLLRECVSDGAEIYSFNYTGLGELLTQNKKEAALLDATIHYMHGSILDNHIIIGAKDGNYGRFDFVQKSFDSRFNPPSLGRALLRADKVTIFGHSLGDCDSQYFKPFFLNQTSNNCMSKVIRIYTDTPDSMLSIKRNIQTMTDNHLSWIYSLNDFRIETC